MTRDDPRGRTEGPEDRIQRERVGVAGDPVPDHEYGEDDHPTDPAPDEASDGVSDAVRTLAAKIAEPGVVTERQALALVLGDVENVRRREAAERMSCTASTYDTLLSRARCSLREAAETVSMLRKMENPPDAVLKDP